MHHPCLTRNFLLPLRHEVGERAGVRWCQGTGDEVLPSSPNIHPFVKYASNCSNVPLHPCFIPSCAASNVFRSSGVALKGLHCTVAVVRPFSSINVNVESVSNGHVALIGCRTMPASSSENELTNTIRSSGTISR